VKSSFCQEPEFAPFWVEYLHAPHVGGHQLNGSVKDVVIYRTVAALANEHGADLLKSQRSIDVRRYTLPPHLEIIFKQGQCSIPSHTSPGSRRQSIISREFLEDFQMKVWLPAKTGQIASSLGTS